MRKTKKEWEACGAVVTSLCTAISTAMDEVDARVEKVRMPPIRRVGWCRLWFCFVSKPFRPVKARGKKNPDQLPY